MLENKLGLTSSAELAREEERISKKKAAMLFENHILDNLESGKFSTLQTIHKYLFDEIYDFAGKLRTVNIAKGNFRFAPLMYIESALKNIDEMPQVRPQLYAIYQIDFTYDVEFVNTIYEVKTIMSKYVTIASD